MLKIFGLTINYKHDIIYIVKGRYTNHKIFIERSCFIMITVTKIEKNRNFLEVTVENGKMYKIDFSTGDIIGLKGNPIQSNPLKNAVISCTIPFSHFWHNLFYYGNFTGRSFWGDRQRFAIDLMKMEKFIPYLDMIDDYAILPDKIPAGYIKWCKENNLSISSRTLTEFEKIEITKNLSKKDQLRLKNIQLNNEYLKELSTNEKLRKVFFTIIENDAKIFKFHGSYCELYRMLKTFGTEFADLTSGVDENIQIYSNHENEQKEIMIQEKENQIRELEKIEHEKYCIIVPKTLQDFTNEGNMQRNCVGYYYHDSIISGENLIYFIRLKTNPEKSLNTCRYNLYSKRTQENRAFCNSPSSEEVTKFIEEVIDKKINEILFG